MQLRTLNPSIKAFSVVILVFMLSFVFDPVTPLLYWIFIVAVTFLFGQVKVRRWLLIFAPFIIISFGYVWTTAIFSSISAEAGHVVFFSFGPFEITKYGIWTGFSLGLRVFCFAALSLLFLLTTDPIKFILSLIQQCKMPPKLAYGLMVGYRFMPLLQEELMIIRHAHQVRGVNREKGLKGKLLILKRYAIPLLASAIRKAERAAIAMESKGFTGERDRTFYHPLVVKKQDWIFLFLMVGLFIICVSISIQLGTFKWYGNL